MQIFQSGYGYMRLPVLLSRIPNHIKCAPFVTQHANYGRRRGGGGGWSAMRVYYASIILDNFG